MSRRPMPPEAGNFSRALLGPLPPGLVTVPLIQVARPPPLSGAQGQSPSGLCRPERRGDPGRRARVARHLHAVRSRLFRRREPAASNRSTIPSAQECYLCARNKLSPMYPWTVFTQSGRRDLNPRPPEPHSGALPDCATSRNTRRQGAEMPRRPGKASPPDPAPSPKDFSGQDLTPHLSHPLGGSAT